MRKKMGVYKGDMEKLEKLGVVAPQDMISRETGWKSGLKAT